MTLSISMLDSLPVYISPSPSLYIIQFILFNTPPSMYNIIYHSTYHHLYQYLTYPGNISPNTTLTLYMQSSPSLDIRFPLHILLSLCIYYLLYLYTTLSFWILLCLSIYLHLSLNKTFSVYVPYSSSIYKSLSEDIDQREVFYWCPNKSLMKINYSTYH